METIQELMLRAQLLKQETALDSISPERAGGIMYDTLAYINLMQLQGANPLLISKIYASVAAMEADSAPVSDLTGQALRPGQVVVIASSDSDNGSVYRYNGGTESRWTVVGKIGNLTPEDSLTSDSAQLPLAARQGKVLDEKVSALSQELNGGARVYSLAKSFPAGQNISVNDKFDFSLPKGKYNLVSTKDTTNALSIYFYDSEGNSVKPTDNTNTQYNSISLPNYTSRNPFDFPADVAKVAFYSAQQPTVVVNATFEATSIVQEVGLIQRVEDVETDVQDLTETVGNISEDVGGLDERVTELEGVRKVVSFTQTELSELQIYDGYYFNREQANTSWKYLIVDNLQEGEVVMVASHFDQAVLCRFVDTYNGNTRVPAYADNSSYRRIFRCPAGVDKVYLTIPANSIQGRYLLRCTFVDGNAPGNKENSWSVSAASLSANTPINLPGNGQLQIRKQQTYTAKCRFSSFSSVVFGQNVNYNKGARVEIDGTNVRVYIRNEANPIYTATHGLTISSFLFITVAVKVNERGSLVLVSDSGSFSVADFAWGASNGDITFTPSMAVTDVTLSYAAKDLLNDVWLFGDSYMSYAPNRQPYYLDSLYGAYENVLSSGYSGAGDADCVAALMTYLQIAKPKYIVWLAGMNDKDLSDKASPTWVDCINFARDVCAYYGAQLILATVPNVPSIDHTFKNSVVETSGEQYIDLANAVGAESAGSTWNPSVGLSDDEVHPSELGAKLLAAQIVLDFPQINRRK